MYDYRIQPKSPCLLAAPPAVRRAAPAAAAAGHLAARNAEEKSWFSG